MTHTVLILTDPTDTVAERVAVELVERGVPVITLDAADFPSRATMATYLGTASNGWTGIIETPRGRLDLAHVGAIYYRRPTQFEVDERMSSPERAFAYQEARRGFGGVLAALRQSGVLWVNDPAAAMRAEYKPVQLAVAARIGLNIPETTIISDPQAAHAWAKELGRPIIYKPLGGIWHADEGKVRVLYTTPVHDLERLLDPALGYTAHLFQEQIDKAYEARAIVVGREVLAVRIDSDSAQGKIDWRSAYDSLRYEHIELPEALQDLLVELHHELDLVYGATDLVCSTNGTWYFLETNQRGEWGWLHLKTGLPVASELANVLERGPSWSR